jgi:hypothetical protein
MKTKQLNKLTMYLSVEGICAASPTVWQPLQAFADAFADLKTHITNIQNFAQSREQDTSGIAVDKQAARAAMCNVALPVARAVHAYALKTSNNQLAGQTDFSLSGLMGGRDVESAVHCQNIHDIANANLALLAPYGITAAQLATVAMMITGYSSLVSKPRDTRAQGKTTTSSIQTEFDSADDALTLMDDLIGQLSNAKFGSDYTNARNIVDIPATHASPAPPTPPPATPHP